MWLVTTGLTMLVLPNISLLSALVIASCTTPTDPVLSNAIVKGSFADQHISPRLRNLISAESGANDGFAYPFLFLAVHLLRSSSTYQALSTWALETILYQVMGAGLLGALIGIAANRALRWSTNHNFIDKESFLCYGIAVGILTVGLGGYLNMDDLLAAFAAGNALTWDDWYRKETEENELQNISDLLLNTSFFVYVGSTIPWKAMVLHGLSPFRLVMLSILVLLFRRLPAMLLFYKTIPRLKSIGEAITMGYFGPIGAGAVFYASLVSDQFKDEDHPSPSIHRIQVLVKPVTYSLVLASVIGHSAAIPLAKKILTRYGVGNVKFIAQEEQTVDFESDLDGSMEESISSFDDTTVPDAHSSAPSNVIARDMEALHHQPVSQQSSYPLYLYPSGEGAYTLDGRWNPHASWRLSSTHGPSSGYRFGPRLTTGNHYHRLPVPNVQLPDEWNARIRYLDESAGNTASEHPPASEDLDTGNAAPPLPHRSQSTAPIERSTHNQQNTRLV